MNKKFYFGLALTAGLFASCSSDDLVGESASSQAFIDNGAPAKIEIGMTPGYEITRGTGRIGTVSNNPTASAGEWEGQEFHVLMLEKGTMLGARTTPNDATTAIFKGAPFTASGSGVIALDNDAVFYPTLKQDGTSVGVYDFWGYRLDDAATTDPETFNGYDVAASAGTAAHTDAVEEADDTNYTAADAADKSEGTTAELTAFTIQANNGKYFHDTDVDKYYKIVYTAGTDAAGNQITVPFEINGTQDLMVAATSPSDQTYADQNPSLIFSAKSARNGVKPNLAFKHLLTSLTFKVKPKSRDITDQADNPTTDPRFVPGYEITNITLKSMATGELIVAYTGDTEPAERIKWTAGQDWSAPATLTAFDLQCRKKQVQDAADIKMVKISTATTASGTLTYDNATDQYIDMNGRTSYIIPAGGAPADLEVYDAEGINTTTTGLPLGNKTTIGALRDAGQDYGWILTYNSVDRTTSTPKKYDCEYKAQAEAVTTDLVPYATNNGMYKYVLKWHEPSNAASVTYTATEITAEAYDALPEQNQGGNVTATELANLTTKQNVHKAYYNTTDTKYYKIAVGTAPSWLSADDVATAPDVIGASMLVAPSNDAANSGYQATVTYKYYQKKNTKTVEEKTKTTDPFVINNYIIDGGNKVKGPFVAGKNYNVTITLYSDGEVVNGEATSEQWGEGGDLDANDN